MYGKILSIDRVCVAAYKGGVRNSHFETEAPKMFLSRRVQLLLAASFSALSLTFVVAAYSQNDAQTESQATGSILKSKILRRQDRLKEKPSASELALLRNQATTEKEREVENKIPNHVPIKTNLKADKEKKFKDVDNPDWYRDFELEVTNKSDKPIYYLNIWLVYPEIISDSGKRVGVVLRYGRMDFVNFDARPIPTDVPILPGATITLKIPEEDQQGWLVHKIRENRMDPKKVELSLTQVSFGDGSGFNGSEGRPYPYKRGQSSSRVCSEEPPGKDNKRQSRLIAFYQAHSMQQPAETLPVNFFPGRSFGTKPRAQSGLCCPGTNCSWKKNTTYYCSCRLAQTTTTTSCSDPAGQCSIDEFIDSWCSGLGVACPEWRVGPCLNEEPNGGGAGGGGGGGGDPPPQQPCTHYYWVYYESYDGGQTWREVDTWYAGCW